MHFTGMFFIILVKSLQSHLQPRNRRKMGKKDIALARFLEDEERYADLINAFVFKGRQVVRAADITERDTRATGVFKRIREKFTVQKYRDVLRRVALGTEFVLIGLENQDEVHYAMPVRVMLQDAAGYDEQLRRIRRENRRRGELRGAEFLGGFSKKDCLLPVLTLVLYYGRKPWDGARELRQMMGEKPLPRPLRHMINNYRIHVLEVQRFREIERFRTDLYEVIGFIQRAGDKDREQRFTEERQSHFESMDEDAYDVITAVTGSDELEAVKEKYREEGGKINMCEAIRGMIEDGKREGLLVGRQEGLSLGMREGKQQGELEKAKTVARNMYRRGMSAEDAAAICEIEQRQVLEWFEEWSR